MSEINRERFDRIRSEFNEYKANAIKVTPKEPTLGDMLADGSFAEAAIKLAQDPDYQKHEVKLYLKMLMGDPDDYSNRGGSFSNPFGIGIIPDEDDPRPYRRINHARIGAFAARVYKSKKAANRLAALREMAQLCGDIADKFEERLREETQIRRIQ